MTLFMKKKTPKTNVGWYEWIDVGLYNIKVDFKVNTGNNLIKFKCLLYLFYILYFISFLFFWRYTNAVVDHVM